ncbi:MAG: TetR/AcrR family transcriptional regulator [Actinomycetota bacterium]
MAIRAVRKRITKRPDERRQDIIDAAVRVFAERGVHGTTVAHITQAAEVAKGTFYLYFDSKEHLLAVLKERWVDESLARAAELLEKVGRADWWALVDTAVENFVDYMLEHRDLIHVFVQEGITEATSEIFAECHRKLDMMFASGIQAGVEAGAFHTTDPMLTAQLLHNALEGTIVNSILYGQALERERLVAVAKETARKILAP